MARRRRERTVYFGAGNTLYALAPTARARWEHRLAPEGDDDDPREIESSPVVVDGLVIFGSDVHNADDGTPAAVFALDAATGEERWTTVTAPTDPTACRWWPSGDRPTGPGCADVWGSPSVDLERRLVFVGTGNCTATDAGAPIPRRSWRSTSTRERWSYQPHEPNRDDLDFAGAQPVRHRGSGRCRLGQQGRRLLRRRSRDR